MHGIAADQESVCYQAQCLTVSIERRPFNHVILQHNPPDHRFVGVMVVGLARSIGADGVKLRFQNLAVLDSEIVCGKQDSRVLGVLDGQVNHPDERVTQFHQGLVLALARLPIERRAVDHGLPADAPDGYFCTRCTGPLRDHLLTIGTRSNVYRIARPSPRQGCRYRPQRLGGRGAVLSIVATDGDIQARGALRARRLVRKLYGTSDKACREGRSTQHAGQSVQVTLPRMLLSRPPRDAGFVRIDRTGLGRHPWL